MYVCVFAEVAEFVGEMSSGGAPVGSAREKAAFVIAKLKTAIAERKLGTMVELELGKKHKPGNRSYPIRLTSDTDWLYRWNVYSDSPRPPHVELAGVHEDLQGTKLVVDLSSLHFS